MNSFSLKLSRLSLVGLLCVSCFVFTDLQTVEADELLLKSGRRLSGKILAEEQDPNSKKKFIVIRTATGGTYKFDQGKIVRKVIIEDEIDREYNRRLAEMPETVEGNWELREWCNSQKNGKSRFKAERKFHLENIIAIDTDNADARIRLGYEQLENGQWVLGDQFAISRGYEKRGTSWAPVLQNQLDEVQERAANVFGAKKREYSIWKQEFKRSNFRPSNQLANALANICDPSSVQLLYNDGKTAQNPDVRAMYVDALATVNTNAAIGALVSFAFQDPDRGVRERAISALSQPQFDHSSVVIRLGEGLRDKNNLFVNQAAFAIAEVASTDDYSRDVILMDLINATVTKHEQATGNLEAGRMNTTIDRSGGIGGMQMGGGPQSVTKEFSNPDVIAALERLTDASFELNRDVKAFKQSWKRWYVENYTNYSADVRGR